MSSVSLFAVIGFGASALVWKGDVESHLTSSMHAGAEEALESVHQILATQDEELADIKTILLRGEIASYVSRICARPDAPNMRAWQLELERLLNQYDSLPGPPYPQELLECE